MMEKYRVHEVAKDLGVPSKEVVDLLGEYYPESPKGHMSALEKEELSVVLEHYTKKNEISDIDSFFAEGRKRREAAQKEKTEKAAAKAEEKPAAKPATKPAAKSADKPAPKEEKKPAEKPVAKPAAKKAETKKVAEEPAQKPAATKAAPAAEKPAEKPVAKPAAKKAEPKKAAEKPVAKSAKKAEPKKEAKPAAKKETKPAAKPKQTKEPVVQAVQEAAPSARRVDMRTVKVNLDKYNERYETIAPENIAKEAAPRKRRSNPRRRRGRGGRPTLSRQEKEAQRKRREEMEQERRQNLEVQLPEMLSVAELADRLKIQVGEIVRHLMKLGVMAAAGEIIDYDTAALVAMEIGAKVEPEVVVTLEDRLFEEPDDAEEDLTARPPVIVVMGHVDHGKTSTLDAIRKTRVTSGEAGGITQHIGAYQVQAEDGRKLTFLDTPGHAAFTSMRSRGAQITDVAIIVVAADDGVMPQTIEAINHAKEAGISIIVAVNKIDLPSANPNRVLQELTEHGLVPEEWGGDTVVVSISAKTGEGLDELLEMTQLTADMLDLKANPDRNASGTVVEASLDRGRGPVATLLVQSGTLRATDHVIAGSAIGRVRAMVNEDGEPIEEAGPSTPVEIIGLSEVPLAGDVFHAVEDERLARELADQRRHEAKEEQFSTYEKVTLENLFDQISEGEMKELKVIVKGDVQGSVEALTQSLEKLTNEEVRVRVIHGGVGAVNESDVMLAMSSNALVVGFNVRPDQVARETAKREDVDIRLYRVIYDAIDEIEDAMKGMLAPKYRDIDLGSAEVREVFKVSNVGTVAGCYVTEGKILRSAEMRVVRNGVIIADDKISSLKRFTDDAREVAQGFECGIGLENFNDIKVGDILEAYEVEEYRD